MLDNNNNGYAGAAQNGHPTCHPNNCKSTIPTGDQIIAKNHQKISQQFCFKIILKVPQVTDTNSRQSYQMCQFIEIGMNWLYFRFPPTNKFFSSTQVCFFAFLFSSNQHSFLLPAPKYGRTRETRDQLINNGFRRGAKIRYPPWFYLQQLIKCKCTITTLALY